MESFGWNPQCFEKEAVPTPERGHTVFSHRSHRPPISRVVKTTALPTAIRNQRPAYPSLFIVEDSSSPHGEHDSTAFIRMVHYLWLSCLKSLTQCIFVTAWSCQKEELIDGLSSHFLPRGAGGGRAQPLLARVARGGAAGRSPFFLPACLPACLRWMGEA